MLGYFTAPRFVLGRGALEQLSALDAHRPLVVVAPSLERDARVQRIVEELAKREVAVSLVPAPAGPASPAAAEALAARVTERAPDWIVAVGGGTTLDLARGAWLRYERPDLPLEEVSPLRELSLRKKARFVAVPTTSGSGADSASSLLLWRPDGSALHATSRELIPDWSLLDPALPTTVPREAAADAAALSLGHALESVTSAWSNPISDALAREAFGQLLKTLPKLAKSPGDPDLGTTVHHAASMAGLAASNAQDGTAAALAEGLAPALGLSYGRAVGIVLPYVAEFSFPSARDAFQSLAPSVGALDHRGDLSQKLRAVGDLWGLPRTLLAAGVAEARVRDASPGIVERARRCPFALSGPRIPSDAEWGKLVDRVAVGGPVDF